MENTKNENEDDSAVIIIGGSDGKKHSLTIKKFREGNVEFSKEMYLQALNRLNRSVDDINDNENSDQEDEFSESFNTVVCLLLFFASFIIALFIFVYFKVM